MIEQDKKYENAKLAKKLEMILKQQKLGGKISKIIVGPIVTKFFFELDKKISHDACRRIFAKYGYMTEFGKNKCAAIVVPNMHRQTIFFDDLQKNIKISQDYLLPIILGVDTSGMPFVKDLHKDKGYLIIGAHGNGKSTILKSVTASLVLYGKSHIPFDDALPNCKIVISDTVDNSMNAWNDFSPIGNNILVLHDARDVVERIDKIIDEIERRDKLLKDTNLTDVFQYNSDIAYDGALPVIVLVINELADVISAASQKMKNHLRTLLFKGRTTGVFVVAATECADKTIITTEMQELFPARIILNTGNIRLPKSISRDIDARFLLGCGDAVFLSTLDDSAVRFHGGYIENDDIKKIILAKNSSIQMIDELRTGRMRPKRLQELIKNGANINNFSSRILLSWADTKLIRVLLDNGIKIPNDIFEFPGIARDSKKVKLLLSEWTGDINQIDIVNLSNTKLVADLIKFGLNVNAKNKQGQTMLENEFRNVYFDIEKIKMLLKAGAKMQKNSEITNIAGLISDEELVGALRKAMQ